MARRSSQDRTRLHPEGSGVAESHRGVVAHVPKTGFGRGGLRRQLRDRSGEEGRYAAAKPESEGMGVGSSSQTTEAPEAHFCVPYLRNGALGPSPLVPGTTNVPSSLPLFTPLRGRGILRSPLSRTCIVLTHRAGYPTQAWESS